MAQKLLTRLQNLEEGMAELQDDKGAARHWPRQPTQAWPQAFPRALRGSARVVQKAEKFDAAEQSAAQVHGLDRRDVWRQSRHDLRTHDRHITTHIHTLTSITSFAHAPYWPYCSSYNFDFRVRVAETLDATCETIFSAELARR